jgi:hypothetical protein
VKLSTVYFKQPMPYGIGLACGAEREPVLDLSARTVTLGGDLVVPLEAVMCWRVEAPAPVNAGEPSDIEHLGQKTDVPVSALPTTDETQPETPQAKRGKR